MTQEELDALSPRRRAEALAAAGLIPEPREDLPPVQKERNCHGCGYRLDKLLVEMGETLHPTCSPPKQEKRRR